MIFISSALQQPRHQKRIKVFLPEFECKVWYFERDGYQLNYKGFEKDAYKIASIKNRRYFSRLISLFKLFFALVSSKDKLVYCTSIDQALVSLCSGKSTIMELGDLQQISSSFFGFRLIDKFLVRKLRGIVLTSPFYWSDYYSKVPGSSFEKILIVENKVPEALSLAIKQYRQDINGSSCNRKNVRVGVIGSISRRESLMRLVELAKKRNDIEIHVYGDGDLSPFQGVTQCIVHGPFKSPEDLQKIYSNIDINFIVYDSQDQNVKIALPNKLYESIAFLKPIVCAKGVALASIVESKGIGLSCDNSEIEKTLDSMILQYDELKNNLLALSEDEYLDFSRDDLVNFVNKVAG